MDAKKKAQETIHAYQQILIDLSHRIHDYPELGFAEEQASRWITEVLADAGLPVETGICDLPTAFRVRAGNGPFPSCYLRRVRCPAQNRTCLWV